MIEKISGKPKTAKAEALWEQFAFDGLTVNMLEHHFAVFAEWTRGKGKEIGIYVFLSKGIDTWGEPREERFPATSEPVRDSSAASVSQSTQKPPVAVASRLRDWVYEWNTNCPSLPTDGELFKNHDWKACATNPEFGEKFIALAEKAESAFQGGHGWLSLPWLLKKKPGDAMRGWEKLLRGDYDPRGTVRPISDEESAQVATDSKSFWDGVNETIKQERAAAKAKQDAEDAELAKRPPAMVKSMSLAMRKKWFSFQTSFDAYYEEYCGPRETQETTA